MHEQLTIPSALPEDFIPSPDTGLTEAEAQRRREQGLSNEVTADPGKAAQGESVKLTVQAQEGFELESITVTGPAGAVELTDELRASLYEEMVATSEDELFDQKMDVWMNEAQIEYAATPAEDTAEPAAAE